MINNFLFLIIFIKMFISFDDNLKGSFINENIQMQQIKNDSIINIPLLEVQDSIFFNILNKIAKYKYEKNNLSQKKSEFYAFVRIAYYGTDIYIESTPDISTIYLQGIPKGVISIGEYDFFYYDPFELFPSFVKSTNSFKRYNFNENHIFGYEEFDSWEFSITDFGIRLDNFYPIDENDKDLFFEIYNK